MGCSSSKERRDDVLTPSRPIERPPEPPASSSSSSQAPSSAPASATEASTKPATTTETTASAPASPPHGTVAAAMAAAAAHRASAGAQPRDELAEQLDAVFDSACPGEARLALTIIAARGKVDRKGKMVRVVVDRVWYGPNVSCLSGD